MNPKQLPDGWHMVKFGEMAMHISKRVEPSETDLDIYVGLEHLDPDSLRIKRHGVPSDVDGQKLLVKKGQIIFGKRRAYQRKLGVADWDCICSAHAMVLEANPKTVLPELLPFFMQSDMFMNRAIAISEGSLSPTIKWSSLSEQSFPFPSINAQTRLLELFNSIERCLSIAIELRESIRVMFSILSYRVTNGLDTANQEWKKYKIKEIGAVITGNTPPKNELKNYGTLHCWATAEDFSGKYIFNTKIMLSETGVNKARLVPVGSVLVTCIASIGKIAIARTTLSTNQQINSVVVNSEFSNEFFYYLIKANLAKLKKYVGTTAVPIINKKAFENIEFLMPNTFEQERIAKTLSEIDSYLESVNSKILQIKQLKKSVQSKYWN